MNIQNKATNKNKFIFYNNKNLHWYIREITNSTNKIMVCVYVWVCVCVCNTTKL